MSELPKDVYAAEIALVAALREIRIAAQRQLDGIGAGRKPSERLQAAFDTADELLDKQYKAPALVRAEK